VSGADEAANFLAEPEVTFGGLIRRSWILYRANLVRLFALFGTIFVTTQLLWAVALVYFNDSSGTLSTGQLASDYLFRLILPAFAGSFAVAATAVLVDATVRAAAPDDDGVVRPSLDRAVKGVVTRSGDVLAGAVMATVIALTLGSFGLQELGIPYIFYGPPILVQVLLLERVGYQVAGMRARSLLGGHWARMLGYLATIAIGIAMIYGAVPFFLVRTFEGMLSGPGLLVVHSVVGGGLLGLMFGFLATAMTVLYYDLDARGARPTPTGPKRTGGS
jgi:hypothetical protein